jgi:hypothetical protein
MQAHLYLIGTVHHDPRGYKKLHALLSALKPELITLELSPYGRGFRTKQRTKLSRKLLSLYKKACAVVSQHSILSDSGMLPPSVAALLCTINYPFEFLAARDYAHAYKVPFYCIDLSHVSRQKMLMLKQAAISNNNITVLLTLPEKSLQESVDLCYKKAQNIWYADNCGQKAAVAQQADAAVEREKHMSRRIKNLVKRHPDKKLVHIGGWEHFTGDAGCTTMYELLRGLSPERILLTDDICYAITSPYNH